VRVRLFLGEALRSLFGNLSTTVAATLTVLISMFLFGLVLALGSWVNSYTNQVKGEVVAKVFFDKEATTKQVEAVRAQLANDADVKSIDFVSKEEALAIMKKRAPELTKGLASNPFGHAFTVFPKRAERIDDIAGRVSPSTPGVDRVSYEEETTKRLLKVAWVLGIVILSGSLVLLVASTILIGNTIRLSIFSRRREIEVMKLVGASNWFVRAPFMLEGLICGLVGAIAAVFLLLVAKELALPRLPVLESAQEDADALAFPLMALILVAVSLLVGAAGSGITLRRFLRI
jgi:cell division transport system permease protein